MSTNSTNFATIADSVADAASNTVAASVAYSPISIDGFTVYRRSALSASRAAIMPLLVQRPFPRELWYRPDIVSLQEYGTPDLWYLILWADGCSDPCDFDGPTMMILPKANLQTVKSILASSPGSIPSVRANPPAARVSSIPSYLNK
jgi:hypothetical protein